MEWISGVPPNHHTSITRNSSSQKYSETLPFYAPNIVIIRDKFIFYTKPSLTTIQATIKKIAFHPDPNTNSSPQSLFFQLHPTPKKAVAKGPSKHHNLTIFQQQDITK